MVRQKEGFPNPNSIIHASLTPDFSHKQNNSVTVVFFVPKGSAKPASGAGTRPTSVEELKAFVGKTVVVKGQLTDHQGDMQMVIPYLEQIKVQ